MASGLSGRSERTRDSLVAAALARFLEQGVEATSVDDIAADAGVTRRTFYRYFPSKEHLLFSDYEARLDWFRAALRVRPQREAITVSVRTAVESFPYNEALHQIAELRTRELEVDLIKSHVRRVQSAFADEIETHLDLREKSPPTVDTALRNRLHANIIGGAMFTALEIWFDEPGHDFGELERLIDLSLMLLRQGVE